MKKILGLLLVGVLLIAVAPINATANTGGDDIVYDNSYDTSTSYVADIVEPLAYNYVTADVLDTNAVAVVVLINKEKVDIGDRHLDNEDDVGWNYKDITYNKNIETENYDLPKVIPLC